jgi:hypothetical protein
MDSLKVVTDSVTDTLAQAADGVSVIRDTMLIDSVDWVHECAHRQAMLIDRIDFWMDMFAGMFWVGLFCFVIYATFRSVTDFCKKRKAKNR